MTTQQPQQIDPTKVATFALGLIARAQVAADDDTISAVQTCRAFLRAIASGELVISQKPAAEAPAAPKE